MEESQTNNSEPVVELGSASKKDFSTKEALQAGWNVFKQQWQFLILALIAPGALVAILAVIAESSSNTLASAIILLALLILQSIIIVGWINIFLKVTRDEVAAWADFKEVAYLWGKYIIGNILYQIIVGIGLIFLIVPGIYFALKYQFYMYALVDNKDIGIWESFQESAHLTKGVKWHLFGLWFVFIGLSILGVLALGVGFIIAWLVMGVAMAHIYYSLKKQTPETPETV